VCGGIVMFVLNCVVSEGVVRGWVGVYEYSG